MLGLGYKVLIENVKFLTARKLVDLIGTSVVVAVFGALRALANTCCDFPVRESS